MAQKLLKTAEPEGRRTPPPAETDRRAAFTLQMLMERRGLSEQGLADAMLVANIENAPSRSTITRIVREAAVPQRRHRRALAEFFFGEDADPTRIWKVRRS